MCGLLKSNILICLETLSINYCGRFLSVEYNQHSTVTPRRKKQHEPLNLLLLTLTSGHRFFENNKNKFLFPSDDLWHY